jgi:orotidine-5'-phosphate decarboxylase
MFNVHSVGGSQMMRQAVEETNSVCAREGIETPLIIGVTVLTSSNESTLLETGINGPVNERVAHLAHLSFDCGLDGVVASPLEVGAVRQAVPDRSFLTVTPGIRPKHATTDDQQRVTSFREAIANGSDYVVIGRPIVQSQNRSAAVQQMINEVTTNK